jgi:hypothetical protein
MPLVGCNAINFRRMNEGFEYFEEYIIGEGNDCDLRLLLKLAYTIPT